MSHALTRRNISAIAKLDFTGLGHAQRIEAIAKAIGFETAAALMGCLKEDEGAPVPRPAKKARAIYAFGSELTRSVSEFDPITDEYGAILSGSLQLIEFDTVAELNAYEQGVADAEGWMDASCFVSEVTEPHHPIFAAMEQEADLTKAYAQARQAYYDEDETDEDEDTLDGA